MQQYIFPIFVLLLLSVLVSWNFSEKHKKKIIIIRKAITLAGIIFYIYWFAQDFLQNDKNLNLVEIRNKLPQTIDFYIIKPQKNKEEIIIHSGKIRPEHYRLERLDMNHTKEIWLVGFLGKNNMVHFSQHSVKNKNIDEIIEVNNYKLESKTLSQRAKKNIENHIEENNKTGVIITLSILFIFINLYVLPKKIF